MFMFFKKVLLLWTLFIIYSMIAGGGGTIREMKADGGGVIQSIIDVVATQADSVKKDADDFIKRWKSWMKDKNNAQNI